MIPNYFFIALTVCICILLIAVSVSIISKIRFRVAANSRLKRLREENEMLEDKLIELDNELKKRSQAINYKNYLETMQKVLEQYRYWCNGNIDSLTQLVNVVNDIPEVKMNGQFYYDSKERKVMFVIQ